MIEPDILDDDYWKGFNGRLNQQRAGGFGRAMHRIDELSRRLKDEAHQEYVRLAEENRENEVEPHRAEDFISAKKIKKCSSLSD